MILITWSSWNFMALSLYCRCFFKNTSHLFGVRCVRLSEIYLVKIFICLKYDWRYWLIYFFFHLLIFKCLKKRIIIIIDMSSICVKSHILISYEIWLNNRCTICGIIDTFMRIIIIQIIVFIETWNILLTNHLWF